MPSGNWKRCQHYCDEWTPILARDTAKDGSAPRTMVRPPRTQTVDNWESNPPPPSSNPTSSQSPDFSCTFPKDIFPTGEASKFNKQGVYQAAWTGRVGLAAPESLRWGYEEKLTSNFTVSRIRIRSQRRNKTLDFWHFTSHIRFPSSRTNVYTWNITILHLPESLS